MPNPDVTDVLIQGIIASGIAREQRFNALVAAMTERERAIFRDGAVAGFVQGTRFARLPHDAVFPKDSFILTDTLGCIDSFPDLYRTVSGYVEDEDD